MLGSAETRKPTLSSRISQASRSWASLFWIAAVLRFLSVAPFVIDDDEAWWSAAARAMKSPWDFYLSAVDHKPPGIVWFYWWVNHLIPFGSDPRTVRAVYTFFSILAAALLGWMAVQFARRGARSSKDTVEPETIGWCAATLFLLVTAIPTPKLLAVTADGLLINLVIVAFATALFVEIPGACLISGMILGLSLLIKQTAVFFALPILLSNWPRAWSVKQILGFAFGAALILVPSIFVVDPYEFFYWNWTYPSEVLIIVRERLFHSTWEMILTLGIFVTATLPVILMMISRVFSRSKSQLIFALRDFRVVWLIAGLIAALAGKGLFLHYLLLFTPPFALLAAEGLLDRRMPRGTLQQTILPWTGIQYVVCCALLLIPACGIFWGTDLAYFSELSRVLNRGLKSGDRIMVWGGSALPLAYTGAPHVTRFVLPRFAVEPYATDRTRELFHQELSKDPPALVLDLHERGDNQFNNPIESEPFVADQLRKNYRLYVSETVPWAKFYFRSPPPASSDLIEVRGEQQTKEAYGLFPLEQKSWLKLIGSATGLIDRDRELRIGATLELLGRQSFNSKTKLRAEALIQQIGMLKSNPRVMAETEDFIRGEMNSNSEIPFPLKSRAWWPSLALVELQPKAFH